VELHLKDNDTDFTDWNNDIIKDTLTTLKATNSDDTEALIQVVVHGVTICYLTSK